MKWIPFSIAAYILAFSNASYTTIAVSMVLCVISFFYALHFDNQTMKFLSVIGRYYNGKK